MSRVCLPGRHNEKPDIRSGHIQLHKIAVGQGSGRSLGPEGRGQGQSGAWIPGERAASTLSTSEGASYRRAL